jgi:hypothetical protein
MIFSLPVQTGLAFRLPLVSWPILQHYHARHALFTAGLLGSQSCSRNIVTHTSVFVNVDFSKRAARIKERGYLAYRKFRFYSMCRKSNHITSKAIPVTGRGVL